MTVTLIRPGMILLIDNYDSFTFNLAHLIGGLGLEIDVRRNDALSAEDAVSSNAEAIVLSPGPCTPNEAGICLDLVRLAFERRKPVFGVCLGMQTIGQVAGGDIVIADHLMHGKTCAVSHQGGPLFEGVPSPFTATRYHSLVVDRENPPPGLAIEAQAADDGEIMALRSVEAPIAGVQFHPESYASEHGEKLIANFLAWAKGARP